MVNNIIYTVGNIGGAVAGGAMGLIWGIKQLKAAKKSSKQVKDISDEELRDVLNNAAAEMYSAVKDAADDDAE